MFSNIDKQCPSGTCTFNRYFRYPFQVASSIKHSLCAHARIIDQVQPSIWSNQRSSDKSGHFVVHLKSIKLRLPLGKICTDSESARLFDHHTSHTDGDRLRSMWPVTDWSFSRQERNPSYDALSRVQFCKILFIWFLRMFGFKFGSGSID